MRKSQSHGVARQLRAGVVVTAAAVAVVAGTATAAFAADIDFTIPTTGPVGGGNTISAAATGVGTAAGATPGARFVSPNTTACPTTFGATVASGATSTTATATQNGADAVSVVVPQLAGGTTSYRLCLYNGTATNSTYVGKSTTNLVLSDPAVPTLSPYAAPVGTTSTTATATGIFLSGVTTPAVTFTAAGTACPTTYSTSGAITTTATKAPANNAATIAVPGSLVAGNTYNVCVYAGNTVGTSGLVGKAQYSVAAATTLSPNVGPSAGGNTVVVSGAAPFLTNATTTPGAIFTRNDCPNTYATSATTGTASKVTNSRVSIAVPSGVALTGSETQAAYKVCVYNGTTDAVSTLATGAMAYTIATPVAVTSADVNSGPSQGGQLVTITGTGFPTAPDAQVSAAIGGAPLSNVRVLSATQLQGTTSPRAPGTAALSVTTLAGTKTTATQPYTYSFGITVSPNTAPPSTTPTLYITGAGFNSITFGSSTTYNAASGRVFLVDNAWFGTAAATGAFGTTDPVTACTGTVIVVSDTELLCTLDLTKSFDTPASPGALGSTAVPSGSYQVVVVTDANSGTLTATQRSQASSGGTFTVADY